MQNVFTVSEVETETFLKHKNPQAHIPSAVRVMTSSQVMELLGKLH